MEKRHRYFFPGYLFYLVLSFYFKIGETRSPECNDKKISLQGRNASVHVTVCNIDLFVTLSRCHAMQFTTTTYWPYSFELLHLNFVLYIVVEKGT